MGKEIRFNYESEFWTQFPRVKDSETGAYLYGEDDNYGLSLDWGEFGNGCDARAMVISSYGYERHVSFRGIEQSHFHKEEDGSLYWVGSEDKYNKLIKYVTWKLNTIGISFEKLMEIEPWEG